MRWLLAVVLACSWSAERPEFKVVNLGPPDPALERQMAVDLDEARRKVVKFFGEDFKKPVKLQVFPTRAALDQYFDSRWHAPKTESWMVAAGVADGIVMLSPKAWKAEASEHDPDNRAHLTGIVTHELVHTFHAQQAPDPEFDGMDDLAWLIEGVATYASGQMEIDHRGKDKEAIDANKAPDKLASAWTGRYRYAVSGSIVRYVDRKYGRKTLVKLLAVKSTEQALDLLKTSERQLLDGWRASVAR